MAIFTPLSSHRFSVRTGDTSGLAAATASAGFVGAMRWSNTTLRARITSIEAGLIVTTGFTAGQLVGYDIVIGRSYSVSSSGGTALTLTGDNTQLRASATAEATRVADARIATTAALTAGTVTPDAQALGLDLVFAATTTQGGRLQKFYDFTSSELGGQILETNEGPIVRNLIELGAGGTVQFWWTVAWDEGTIG